MSSRPRANARTGITRIVRAPRSAPSAHQLKGPQDHDPSVQGRHQQGHELGNLSPVRTVTYPPPRRKRPLDDETGAAARGESIGQRWTC